MSCTESHDMESETPDAPGFAPADDQDTTTIQATTPPATTDPLHRIEHSLDAAFQQLEAVSDALAESTSTLRMVPLEQVALAARIGVLMSDLRAVRQSLGTLVIRQMVPAPRVAQGTA